MTALLDVNVLVALAWPNHIHHVAARSWFAHHATTRSWATTPVTEGGFVRISSNPRANPTAATPSDAIAMLATITQEPGHRFVADDVEDVVGTFVTAAPLGSHRDITDAHLLALARRHGAMLATFDRAIASIDGPDGVEIIPA